MEIRELIGGSAEFRAILAEVNRLQRLTRLCRFRVRLALATLRVPEALGSL